MGSAGRCRVMSGPYRTAYDRVLPNAVQVADPFQQIRLANQRLDDLRRHTQNETLDHRGRTDDPLYRIQRVLTAAHEKISHRGHTGDGCVAAAGVST